MVYLIYLMKRAKDIDEQKEKGRPPYITRLRDIYRVPRKKVVHLLKSPNKTVVLGVLFGVFPGRTFFRGTLYTVFAFNFYVIFLCPVRARIPPCIVSFTSRGASLFVRVTGIDSNIILCVHHVYFFID